MSFEQERLLRFLLAVPLFLVSLSIHEFAHGWMAKRFGDTTAEEMGRLTLDPRAHLDPMGLLFFAAAALSGLPLVGWAKPVPVDLGRCRHPLKAMFWIAVAGPLSNFALAAVTLLVLLALLALGADALTALSGVSSLVAGDSVPPLSVAGALAGEFLLINLLLGIFNLFPLPPLDGGRIAVSLLPYRFARPLAQLEPYGFIILMVLLYLGVMRLWLGVPMQAAIVGLATLIQALGLA